MVGKNSEQVISIKVELELETTDYIKNLFGSLESGGSSQIGEEKIELVLQSTGNSLAFDGGTTAELILTFSVGVASGVVANVIYAAICKGIRKLEINGKRTRITEESIAQSIEIIRAMQLLSKNSGENSKETNVDDKE